jgi:D-sedoheptulose 7-phosphate isomerase
MDNFKRDFQEAKDVLEKFIANEANFQALENAGTLMVSALKDGKKLISCGNGGSMSDAMHFAEELTGRLRDDRKAIAAIAISDPTHLSCVANDYGFDYVFSRYIEALGNKGDILLAISTSGDSPNVINASLAAKEKGMKVIALTGKNGGKLAEICDCEIRAPHYGYSERIQEIHIKVVHSLINFIEENL